jgi:hypothetical protein
MLTRTIAALSLAVLVQSPGVPAQPAAVDQRMMTEDAALSALRSNGTSAPGADLVIVRRIEPTPETRRVAEASLHEIESRHLTGRSKGLLAEFLRAGGFVVLECDRTSDVATKIHLVTLDQTGAPLVESERIEGVGSRRDAQALIAKGAELSDAVFSPSAPRMDSILARFGSTEAAMLDLPGNVGFFGISESVKKFATPEELSDLWSVSAVSPLWALRRALALPVFAADAAAALRQAGDELLQLGEGFLTSRGERKGAGSIDDLFNPESIHTRDELATRIRQLKALNSLLDNRSPLALDSATLRVNAAISSIPLKLYGPAKDNRQLYVVMTASGLLSGWTRTRSGGWVLKALTMVGD